jgi:hypothetical protein
MPASTPAQRSSGAAAQQCGSAAEKQNKKGWHYECIFRMEKGRHERGAIVAFIASKRAKKCGDVRVRAGKSGFFLMQEMGV